MIYEMITVEVIPGKLEEFHDVWLKESLPYWEKHGIKHIGSWETVIGDAHEVFRLFAFDDFAHYERWRRFLSDDEEGKQLSRRMFSYLTRSVRKILRPY
ncbi:NIPSNAP family protein [Chloroflexota bacterium]